jgi:hypothetical protein
VKENNSFDCVTSPVGKVTVVLFIFIGILQNKLPHLEVAFCTEGVFNTPKYIMKILQHYLNEVQDVEALIASMDKNK